MKIKYQHIQDVLELLRSEVSTVVITSADLDIQIREENFENGQILGCLTVTFQYEKPANTYEKYKTKKNIKYTIEIFEDNESRSPRLTMEETRDLIPKN